MKSKYYYWLLAIGYWLLALLPTTVLAEIYTANDWIGIYAVSSDDDQPVSGSGKYVNCSTTATNPVAASSCSFTTPSTPGLYHFRMEANRTESNNVWTPIAISSPFWVSFIASGSISCSGTSPTITITWPYIYGLEPEAATGDYFEIYRDTNSTGSFPLLTTIRTNNAAGNSYTDSSGLTSGTPYYYRIRAFSFYNSSIQTSCYAGLFCSATNLSVQPSCAHPWIQTTGGGDVHSNTRINTPGGPP